jgi:hypothetical protein
MKRNSSAQFSRETDPLSMCSCEDTGISSITVKARGIRNSGVPDLVVLPKAVGNSPPAFPFSLASLHATDPPV